MIKKAPHSFAQCGLTLVELMVAMAIGLFIVGAASVLYVKTRSGFDYTNEVARMQETARFAMAAIGHDIREAGFNGCGTNSYPVNIVTLTAANQDFINIGKANGAPIKGYDGSGYPSAMTTGASTPVAGTDAIILQGGDSTREMVVKTHVPPTITLGSHDFKAGEILVANDCTKAAVFSVSSKTATTVLHATSGSPANCHQPLNLQCSSTTSPASATLKAGSLVMPVFSNAYFIADSASGGTRSLWVMQLSGQTTGTPVARELLVGVVDMQISYGLDANQDGKVDSTSDTPSNWGQVATVTVELTIAPANQALFLAKDKSTDAGKGYKRFRETFVARNRTI